MADLRNRPADLGGLSPALVRMRPAPAGRRALARLTDLTVLVVAGLLLGYVQRTLPDASDPRSVTNVTLGVQAAAVLLCVILLGWFARTGRLPGDAAWGLRQVRVGTARPPGWAGAGKYLLMWLLSIVTLGIGYLVTAALAVRAPYRRSWLDRLCGLVVADVRAGRDPMVESAGDAVVPTVPVDSAVADLRAEHPELAEITYPRSVGRTSRPAAEPFTRANPQVGRPMAPVLIRLPGGSTVQVSGPTAFGRNPSPPPDHPTSALAVVVDPDRSVSKTHALLTPQADGLLVEDLASTNGTSVISGTGRHVPVIPGERVTAQVGWQVALGHVILVVEQA